MPTVSNICDFLNRFAPPHLAESWDNVGLLIGRQATEVRKIITCLTLTPDVAHEAIATSAQMIVTHHPVMFRGTKRITDEHTEGKMLLQLIENGIAVYSPHTSFDSAAFGINQQIATDLELQDIEPLKPSEFSPNLGSGRHGKLPHLMVIDELLHKLCRVCRADHLEVCIPASRPIKHIAVACGAAEGFLPDAIKLGCDTFITGEARFHTALEARSLGINLILTGHFPSERPAVESLATIIREQITGIEVLPSAVETNPVSLWLPVR